MILQVQDIIKDAMGIIGATAIDEVPTATELNAGLRILNVMIDSWSARKLMLRSSTDMSFPLTTGVRTYTIGPTGAWVAARPVRIQNAFVRDSNNTDTHVDVISKQVYNDLQDKLIAQARPVYVEYDPGVTQQAAPVGTMSIFPIPDQSYTFRFSADVYLTEFGALTDTVTMEPAYYEPLMYDLAIRLYRRYHEHGKPIPPDILATARQALKTLEVMNATTPIAAIDIPRGKPVFNIYTDQYN